jgi:hypothetical protein
MILRARSSGPLEYQSVGGHCFYNLEYIRQENRITVLDPALTMKVLYTAEEFKD